MNVWRRYVFYLLCIIQLTNLVLSNEDDSWSDWSPCTKSCGIGTRYRSRHNNTESETETQYCNTGYCPDIKRACNSTSISECYPVTGSRGECVNGICQCTLSESGSGYGYNKYNCFPEYGNCIIRIEPPTALGYRDPQQKPSYSYKLHSCTTDDNKINEVHIVGIYGDRIDDNYKVTILPRGPVTKPIILVLTSYEQTNWIINSSVNLAEVLYGGYHATYSTVVYNSSFTCTYPTPKLRTNLKYGYGSDTGGGSTLQVLKTIGQELGPITSFTGYYELGIHPFANIILKVGGDPLSVIPKEYTYNLSMVECNPWFPKCKYPYKTSDQTWGEWSPCSKSCGIGLRTREICNSTGYLIKKEEVYCNMQYCPDIIKTCNGSSNMECYSVTKSFGGCVNGTCQCTLSGSGYNKYNCAPEYGNCIIRIEPPTALGYRDPQQKPSYSYKLFSCTTDDNKINEVHIIGIYGDRTYDNYKVTILPRGPVTKPIILVLTSYEQTNWIINSSVNLAEVLYGGYYATYSTVVFDKSSFTCTYPIPKLRADLKYGYGSDIGGGNTLQVFKTIGQEFGPITSFTGYYEISVHPFANIILKVGGDPLSVIPKEYTYNNSMVECNLWFPKCKYPYKASDQTWGEWSPCSKSCGIGLRTREICNSTGYLIKKEEVYCNMQYCPDIKQTCTSSLDCYSVTGRFEGCVDGICQCTLSGSGYNKYNCFPEYGNCIIRIEPPTALGYRDPQQKTTSSYKLHSCTTNDNKINEVHIIGIYGDRYYNNYKVTILPRGPVTKPIILVLTSYEQTNWIINSSVDLAEVLYGGYYAKHSTVAYELSFNCTYPTPKLRTDLKNGYGSDTGGGNTLQVLKTIGDEFGPITSFTGYYGVNRYPFINIILKVGGDPLFVVPRNYIYNLSMVECSRCKIASTDSDSNQPWGQWSPCSKGCDIGTRVREICNSNNSTDHLIKKEEEYCNMQFCPVTYKCTSVIDCNYGLNCVSYTCRCNKRSDYYNEYNCNPQYGNCIIRRSPPTSLGYKDPDMHYRSASNLYSCTTRGNSRSEIHVIGIHGSRYENEYMISVLPRGPITKPIILVLVAYYPTYWKINTTVDLEEVLYGGYRADSSSVEPTSSSRCIFTAQKRWSLGRYGFGDDTFGGNTVDILKDISGEYGAITSFTGYKDLKADLIPHIILKVGGNPLAVIPANFTYNLTMVSCTDKIVSDQFCRNPNTANDQSWGQWTPCSKSCDVGTRTRERCNATRHLLETEKEFCNLQYCPDDWIPCYESSSPCLTFEPFNSRARCVDGKCQCTLGEYYNKNNCYFEFGNCITREHSPTALSYKDPSLYYIHKTGHLSCVSNENTEKEIHVIAIKGSFDYNTLEITIIPRGPTKKPIIVVLASYNGTRWKINNSVDIDEIVYIGNSNTTLERSGTSDCHFRATKRFDITSWHGIDSDIINLLKITTVEYGPITSFSSFSSINADPHPNIILTVGGNPLAVPSTTFNNSSLDNECTSSTEWETMCKYKRINQNEQKENTWMGWTRCSKFCNEGIRFREKCNTTWHLLEREEQYCNMEPCRIETKKTCHYLRNSCSFVEAKSETGICMNETCYCLLGEEYVPNNCFPRYGNCIIRPNPLSALSYSDPSVTSGYKALYSCTANDNPIFEVHVIAILASNSLRNEYNIAVVAKGEPTKPIILILTSSVGINWKINSQVGIYKVIYGGKDKLFSSVTKETGCNFIVEKDKIDEFGYGVDSREKETLMLLKRVGSQYGPITSFTGYDYLDTHYLRIILNVGGDPLQVPPKNNTYGKAYHNCSTLRPPLHPVLPTTTPTARSGTISVLPFAFGKYAIRYGEYLKLDCYYLSNGPLTGKETLVMFDKRLESVSLSFTLSSFAGKSSLNLTATKRVTTLDFGTYTCMEMSSGISANVEVLVVNYGSVLSWSEWSTCSLSCGTGVRSRLGHSKLNLITGSQNQYCNLQYCPDEAKKCYQKYCEPDFDNMQCILGASFEDICFPYFDNCIIRKNPKVALGYRDPSRTVVSNLYSCTTSGNPNNEVHIIGIYGDKNFKDYTVDIQLRGQVTKPIILVLTSYHNTYWTINTSVDISKILYYDRDLYASTVVKWYSSRCGFSATEYRKDLKFGYGVDNANSGDTYNTIRIITNEFGTITSFTGYLHIRPSSFFTSSHIILNVGGDPLSVVPQEFSDLGCKPPGSFNETQPQKADDSTELLPIILPCVAVGVIIAVVCLCCCFERRCKNGQRPLNRYQVPTVPSEVAQQGNEPNPRQEHALSESIHSSAPPPTYNEIDFLPPANIMDDSPPSYETVMKDYQHYQQESYM